MRRSRSVRSPRLGFACVFFQCFLLCDLIFGLRDCACIHVRCNSNLPDANDSIPNNETSGASSAAPTDEAPLPAVLHENALWQPAPEGAMIELTKADLSLWEPQTLDVVDVRVVRVLVVWFCTCVLGNT